MTNCKILIIQLLFSGIILGILWFIQLIHYPLFFKIKEDFEAYEKEHIKRMTYLIIPLIIPDVFLNVLLTLLLVHHPYSLLLAFSLGFNLMTWLSTLFFQIDQHKQLSCCFSLKTLKALVKTSWIRTVLWTFKTACLIAFFILYLK